MVILDGFTQVFWYICYTCIIVCHGGPALILRKGNEMSPMYWPRVEYTLWNMTVGSRWGQPLVQYQWTLPMGKPKEPCVQRAAHKALKVSEWGMGGSIWAAQNNPKNWPLKAKAQRAPQRCQKAQAGLSPVWYLCERAFPMGENVHSINGYERLGPPRVPLTQPALTTRPTNAGHTFPNF